MDVTVFGKYHGNHGPSRVTFGLSRALAQAGHSLTVLSYGDREDPPHPEVELIRLSSMPGSVREWHRLYGSVKDHVSETESTIFHALERYPYSSDVRTIQWTSDMFIMWQRTGRRPPIRSLIGETLMNWYSRSGVTAASITVAQSPETVDQMRRLWRTTPDEVVPLGIDASFRCEPSAVNEPPRVLLVGRIEPRKGQQHLLRHLNPETELYDLRIAGSISDEAYADRALKGWRNCLLGYLSNEELEREYERADIVVVPSHLENFSMVGLEALAKGCSLIITRGCGLAQFDWATPDNGVHVADDGRHAAELLDSAVISDSLADWQKKAFELTADLTWEQIAQRYTEIYERAVDLSAKPDSNHTENTAQ